PWFNQEWLSQVFYYELYRAGGGLALALFKFAAVLAAFGLATWIGWRRSGSLVFAAGTAVAAVFVCRPFLDIRAQLFLFLGTLAVLAVVEAYRHGARPWTLALLPIVMLLWTNLHFSFVYGLGLVAVLAGVEALKLGPSRPRARWLVAASVGAGLACLGARRPHGRLRRGAGGRRARVRGGARGPRRPARTRGARDARGRGLRGTHRRRLLPARGGGVLATKPAAGPSLPPLHVGRIPHVLASRTQGLHRRPRPAGVPVVVLPREQGGRVR